MPQLENRCVFCRIIAGELPASVVYQDEHVVAFLDHQPITPGHMLVVPRVHVACFVDLPVESACHLMRVGQYLDCAIRHTSLRCEAVTLFLSDGSAAGQEVDHVHLHVLPRFEGDGFVMRLDYRYRQKPDRNQLDAAAAEIRGALPETSN